MKIAEANVTIMVADMQQAVRFYVDVLGLELKANYGGQFAQVAGPGIVIGLHPRKTGDEQRQGPRQQQGPDLEGVSIGFGVGDLDAAMTDLKAAGVTFSKVVEDRPTKLAFFVDPDGNPLYLSETARRG